MYVSKYFSRLSDTCHLKVGESYGFVRSSDEQLFPKAEFPDQVEDTTTGRDAPDIEVYACKSFNFSFALSIEWLQPRWAGGNMLVKPPSSRCQTPAASAASLEFSFGVSHQFHPLAMMRH